jgi:hypothetical protein
MCWGAAGIMDWAFACSRFVAPTAFQMVVRLGALFAVVNGSRYSSQQLFWTSFAGTHDIHCFCKQQGVGGSSPIVMWLVRHAWAMWVDMFGQNMSSLTTY